MHFSLPWLLPLALNHLFPTSSAYLTHAAIRNLTATTEDCRDRIEEVGGRENVLPNLGNEGGGGQVVLGTLDGRSDGEEIEVVSV